MADDTESGPGDRRRALKTLASLAGAAGCASLAVPAVRFALAPAEGGPSGGRWIKTVPLESLVEGEPRRVVLIADRHDAWTLEKQVELGAVWLEKRRDGVSAWSTVCPHLGCAVARLSTGPGFYCPCHDSSFDPDGRRLTGPSPRAMDSLATRIDGGTVLVDFQRFRQGTPEKEPVG